jgi:hypothetical protein
MHSASPSSQEPTISLRHLHRIYHLAGEDIHAVNDVTMDLWPGYIDRRRGAIRFRQNDAA